jgi:hypothetical protein
MLHGSLQKLTRRSVAVACVLLACTAGLALALTPNSKGSAAKATARSPFAAFPALNSAEPSGLTLVTHHGNEPGTPSEGPTFPATPPPGATEDWPEARSIRKVPVELPTLSVWIAESVGGGVCVLSSGHAPVRPGVYGVAFSCAPAGRASAGATVESETAGSNRLTIAGVVPVGVSAVQVALADGSTKTAAVSGGAWALEAAAPMRSVHDVIGG